MKRQKYQPERVDKVYQHLSVMYERGQPRDFEIQLDGIKVVPRTNDVSLFYAFEESIDSSTSLVLIKLYHGKSRGSENFLFEMKETDEVISVQKMEERINMEVERRMQTIRQESHLSELEELVNNQEKIIEDQLARIEELEKDDQSDILQLLIGGLNQQQKTLTSAPDPVLDHLKQNYSKEVFESSIGVAYKLCENTHLIEPVKSYIIKKLKSNEVQRKKANITTYPKASSGVFIRFIKYIKSMVGAKTHPVS